MTSKQNYDVIVIGAGAGGLAAATFAALKGASTLLIESTEYVGGTSAYSAGTTWAPNTRLAQNVDAQDSPEDVLTYLDLAVGNHAPRILREAFVENAPKAIHTLMDQTQAQFRSYPKHPDYLTELEGSAVKGRALEPLPFNAAVLGKDMALIRPPIPEFTIFGGLMVDRNDINHLLKMTKSFKSFWHAFKLILGFGLDKLRYGRSTRLVMGNALIGRLLLAAKNAGVEIVTNAHIEDIENNETATLLKLKTGENISAASGLILATGGFARHPTKRRELLPHPTPEYSPSAPGHRGALHDIVLKMGGEYGKNAAANAFMAPVSLKQRKDGSMAVFPHFVFDRSKPHTLCVDQSGNRFTNEARSYHEFALAQYATGNIPCFILTDSIGLKKYGLGMVRPNAMGAKQLEKEGYLIKADTLQELAAKIEVDAQNLEMTISRFNEFVRTGKDKDFHRGETIYECHNGDATHLPNPTLGEIKTAPFYSVKLYPADIGASTGFVTNENAQILDQLGIPIPRIYACGNDMHSIMGGVYPGPGITIGPAITFGYIAAHHALAENSKSEKA